jgi:hypothetical protein
MNLRFTGVACVAILSCLAGAASADPADDLVAGLQKCASVTDDRARLACYDALAPHAQAALASAPPPPDESHPPTKEQEQSWFGLDVAGMFNSSPPQQITPQQFGSDRLPSTHAKEDVAKVELDSISVGVSEYAFTPFGKFIVFLDNGQVWRQIPADTEDALSLFHKRPTDNKVTIERGLIGSYNLTINDSSREFKVTRIK